MDITEINHLLTQVQMIWAQSNQKILEKKNRGEYFNVFTTLGLWSEEVRLHSAFLSELLNPRGNHGMGDAFLRQLLLTLGEHEDFIDSTKVNPSIVERNIGYKTEEEGGRLDIIIEDGWNAIIIENKIYAIDQDNQLLRYENYGKKFPGRHILVYLTLDGKDASECSTAKQNLDYIRLSYGKDIIAWLYECAKLAYDIPAVRETIKQYIQLLRQLTYQDMEQGDIKKIAEQAVDNIEATAALMASCDEISKILRERYILKPLKEWANKNQYEFKQSADDLNVSIDIIDPKWKHGKKIRISSDNSRNTKLRWHNMFIGIPYSNPTEGKKLNCLKESPTEDWPYGYEWLNCSDWQSTSSYMAMRNDVAQWLIWKIKEMLKEIEEIGGEMIL